MNPSFSMVLMASGFWVVLLVGCGLFAIIALRQRRRAERAEQQLRELDGEGAPANPINAADADAVDATSSELLALDAELSTLKQDHEEALARCTALGAEIEALEMTNAEQQGSIKALETERNMLERQMKNLSAGLEAGDKDTMREMIVNFTEESRELLVAIEEMGKEKAELLQKIADMEAEGKGTAGTVIGLQRKLQQAELEISELKVGR